MGYIGNSPALNETVTTSQIVDDAVTAAKMANGAIVQVQSTTSTAASSAVTTKASSDDWTNVMSVSITPSDSSNKVMIFVTANVGADNASDSNPYLRLARGSTAIFIGDAASDRIRATTTFRPTDVDAAHIECISFTYLDSPSTTSAVTYNCQMAIRGSGSGNAYLNRDSANSDSIERGRPASSITVMEVVA